MDVPVSLTISITFRGTGTGVHTSLNTKTIASFGRKDEGIYTCRFKLTAQNRELGHIYHSDGETVIRNIELLLPGESALNLLPTIVMAYLINV